MKINEPAPVVQERALPRTLSARSFGYACLILIAIVSRDAFAQIDVSVTLLPGEYTKTIIAPQAPNTDDFVVLFNTPMYFCDWPRTDLIKTQIGLLASSGSLQARLTQMESIGTASDDATRRSLQALMNGLMVGIGGTPFDAPFPDNSVSQEFKKGGAYGTYNTALPLTNHVMRRDCLTSDEARTAINEIRRIIRAYLGMSAP